jgi:hypothetical protein
MTIYRDATWFDDKDDFANFLKHYKKVINNYNEGIDERANNTDNLLLNTTTDPYVH